MEKILEFCPDIIIECTSVCDRKCPGCYAPNVVSNLASEKLMGEKPWLYLCPKKLEQTLSLLVASRKKINCVAIRGGEPSRHPLLSEILQCVAQVGENIYLETHGRWILDNSEAEGLLNVCNEHNIKLKISFDSMHNLSAEKLKDITDKLEARFLPYVIAITESSFQEFSNIRQTCRWIPDDQFIFQQKVLRDEELVKPSLGVISVNGRLKSTLNSKLLPVFKKQEVAV